jgi:hypothetical protein
MNDLFGTRFDDFDLVRRIVPRRPAHPDETIDLTALEEDPEALPAAETGTPASHAAPASQPLAPLRLASGWD